MDRKNHGDKRWTIVHGTLDGVAGFALEALVRAVTPHVPYILTVLPDSTPDEDLTLHNLLVLGTTKGNRRLAQYAAAGVFEPELRDQGFAIHVGPSPLNPERTLAVICGADDEGALYGVRDFFHRYADPMRYGPVAVYNKPTEVFQSPDTLPAFTLRDAPAYPMRGFWTWGHVVWDYRRYIDHMTLWKLNVLTLWNDFVPVNAKVVIDYAHRRGIQVVWGFSWCWGVKVDPTDLVDMERWRMKVVETYERDYAPLGVDGIYFQTFTEHIGEEVGGRSSAAWAVDWVNHIACSLLERHPDLPIHFGLHATAVQKHLEEFTVIDPRISIVWEDAGCFPYHHDPKKVEGIADAVALTDRTAGLRGSAESWGAVLKGLTMLSWPDVEHQKGPFVRGETDENQVKRIAADKEFIWKYAQTYWIRNLDPVLAVARAALEGTDRAGARKRDWPLLSALVEDCAWEEKPYAAAAIFAEVAWNPYRPAEEIVEQVQLSRDAAFL